MKKVLIAFDVDGTLRKNTIEDRFVPNERVCRMLIDHAHAKNAVIMVWSGGGELYARQAAAALGLDSYVNTYADKCVVSCAALGHESCAEWHFQYDGPQPDIAYDDIQSFNLAKTNIIVREK
jgi:phosphoserine phosphatase